METKEVYTSSVLIHDRFGALSVKAINLT